MSKRRRAQSPCPRGKFKHSSGHRSGCRPWIPPGAHGYPPRSPPVENLKRRERTPADARCLTQEGGSINAQLVARPPHSRFGSRLARLVCLQTGTTSSTLTSHQWAVATGAGWVCPAAAASSCSLIVIVIQTCRRAGAGYDCLGCQGCLGQAIFLDPDFIGCFPVGGKDLAAEAPS